MRVPDHIVNVFDSPLSDSLAKLLEQNGHLPKELDSVRFLRRSIVPHLKKFSDRFNRIGEPKSAGVDSKYWSDSSNPKNYRLAYLLYYMPPHAFQAAAIWAELNRLGFRFDQKSQLEAIELGAGPGSAAIGIAAAESQLNRNKWNFTLADRDRAILKMGCGFANDFFKTDDFRFKPKSLELDWTKPFFDRKQKFDLIVLSYFLNESDSDIDQMSNRIYEMVSMNLSKKGILIVLDSALKFQSRKVLQIRENLIERSNKIKILTPCLGNQSCGALKNSDDWCHETVKWWRPKYFQLLDKEMGMKHIDLPFSYFVSAFSNETVCGILPDLKNTILDMNSAKNTRLESWQRVISPVKKITKQKSEIFVCGASGKHQIEVYNGDAAFERGDIICLDNES